VNIIGRLLRFVAGHQDEQEPAVADRTEREALRAFVREILKHRFLDPKHRETLVALLLRPRARTRYPGLGDGDVRAVAEEFIAVPPPRVQRGAERRTAA
jgi:hypothetical protein